MAGLLIRSLSSGGVITNYHCVSACGHCLYNCGPHRSKAYLDSESAAVIFRRILKLGCPAVHIGGGEPLLNPPRLIKVLTAARNTGISIDYVETNAAWFTALEPAKTLLKDLKRAGLETLLVSISPFHNAYIPFGRTLGLIDACRRTGIRVFPWVNAFVRDLSRLDPRKPHAMEEFKAAYGNDYLERIPDRYWIHLGGRALETFRQVSPLKSPEEILDQSPSTCTPMLADTSHFHVDLFGNYIPGLCAGLALEIKDIGTPLSTGKYPLIDRLTAGGIKGLYDLAQRRYSYTPSKERFLNHCDLCTDIRKFLLQSTAESFLELKPAEFYIQ